MQNELDVSIHSRLCRKGDYKYGKWTEKKTTQKSFQCCSDNKRTNSENCQKIGVAVRAACVCDLALPADKGGIKQSENFKWETDRCELLRWNQIDFCEELGDRKIFMIGDSTFDLLYHTLIGMVAAQNLNRTSSCVYNIQKNLLHEMGTEKEASLRGEKSHHDMTVMKRLKDVGNIDILIFSLGAHVGKEKDRKIHSNTANETAFKIRNYNFLHTWKKSVQYILDDIKEYEKKFNNGKKIQIIYATAQVGIPNCNEYEGPMKYKATNISQYNWQSMYMMNDFAVDHFPNMGYYYFFIC
jgi:hypothetical protein